jgi:release factor glutamine methyltransferase
MQLSEIHLEYQNELASLYTEQERELIFWWILAERTSLKKWVALSGEKNILTESQILELQKDLKRLKSGEPMQYVLGSSLFYRLKIKVNPAVLIPRPETEELVGWALEVLKLDAAKVIDLGTGSGCIALSLKKDKPQWHIWGVEKYPAALATAKENGRLNKLDIRWVKADILNLESLPDENFNLIISNPPYVRPSEKEGRMDARVIKHEPQTALFAAEDDPLQYYRSIANYALSHLKPQGYLMFEINQYLAEDTAELIRKLGFQVELKKDLSGNNRFLKGIKE